MDELKDRELRSLAIDALTASSEALSATRIRLREGFGVSTNLIDDVLPAVERALSALSQVSEANGNQ